MSGPGQPKFRRMFPIKGTTITANPTPKPSASGFAGSGHRIVHSPLAAKDSATKPDKMLLPNQTPFSQTAASATSAEEKVNITKPDRCAICLDDYTEPKQLDKCGHTFCTDCIDHYFRTIKPQCPCCFTIYGELRGNQPEEGTMNFTKLRQRLSGFEKNSFGTLKITYTFPNGIQDERHPSPGSPYDGTSRDAYLPDNRDGRHVLELLKKAFALRQIFTVGQSRTTGCDNVVTWNDIHHKTSMNGGMENFGYPDKTYLNRVQQELAAKGIK